MAHAKYLAGIAFNNASLGCIHSMTHQLGGYYNLPHGVCNVILLPYVEMYKKQVIPERFADIARAMGEKKKLSVYTKELCENTCVRTNINDG